MPLPYPLPIGAIELETWYGEESGIVLCKVDSHYNHRFATWMFKIKNDPNSTQKYLFGHYSDLIEEAVQDFAERKQLIR